jgi:hypothetical protein
MRGITQFLGAITFVWVLALVQSSTHGNRAWAGSYGDLPSCERIHTALIQSNHGHIQTDTSVPTPVFNPPIIPTVQRALPPLKILSFRLFNLNQNFNF